MVSRGGSWSSDVSAASAATEKHNVRRRGSSVSLNQSSSGLQSLYTTGTSVTDMSFLGGDDGQDASLMATLRLSAKRTTFTALHALTSASSTSNGLSALVLLGEFLQFIPIIASGRFASAWDLDLPNSTLFLGYFDSTFGVLAALFVAVLTLMIAAFLAALWVSTGSEHSVVTHVLKVYVLRPLLLAFLTVGYLPAAVLVLRVPAGCLPWLENAPRDAAGRLLVDAYADEGLLCNTPQTMLMSFVGVVAAAILIGGSVALKAVYHDTDPTSPSIQARSHSRVAVVEIVVRTLVAILFVVSKSAVGDVLLMIVLFVGSSFLLVAYFLHLPYYSTRVNMFKVFGAMSLTLYAIVLPVAYFTTLGAIPALRTSVFLLVLVAGVGMALLARRRIYKLESRHRPHLIRSLSASADDMGGTFGDTLATQATTRLRNSALTAAVARSSGLPKFSRVTEVEIVARMRLQCGMVDDAGLVFERGLAQFPDSPLLRLQYASFLFATGAFAEADVMLDRLDAQALEMGSPLYDISFGIFSLRKGLSRRRQTEGDMDVASYVKYNARLVMAIRAHGQAMRHVHTLWSLVLRSDEEFLRRSSRMAETIHRYTTRADKLFMELLREYPNVTPIIRAYAEFLEEVKHDELKADKLRHRADILEGRRKHGVAGKAGEGGIGLGGVRRVDTAIDHIVPNEQTDVVLTITAQGRIVSANHNVSIFGYSIEGVMGRNVSQLVPIEGSSVLEAMEAYRDGASRTQLEYLDGKHRSGNVVRVVADLTPVSVGADPKFALVLRPVRRGAVIYHSGDGVVLSVNSNVRKLLGWRPVEMVNEHIDTFLPGLLRSVASSRALAAATSPRGSISSDESEFEGQVSLRTFTCKNRSGKPIVLEALSVTELRRSGLVRCVTLSAADDVCALSVSPTGRVEHAGDNARTVLCQSKRQLVGAMVGEVLAGLTAKILRQAAGVWSRRVFSVMSGDGGRQLVTVHVETAEAGSGVGKLDEAGMLADGGFTVLVWLVGADTGNSMSERGAGSSTLLSSTLRSGSEEASTISGASANGAANTARNIGGSVRRSHRFRVKTYASVRGVMCAMGFVAVAAILGLFVYALVVRSSLRQTPIRMGLHSKRLIKMVDAVVELRSADIVWSSPNASVAGVTFEYHADQYLNDVETIAEISPVLLNGNESVASMFEMDVEYAAFWTNSSRAVLEVATGDCSDETHFRNLTYEATVGLLSSHLAHGTELTPADVDACHAKHSVPASEYFVLRNSLTDLRVAMEAGLLHETEAGRGQLHDIRAGVYVAVGIFGGAVLLLWPFLCLMLVRMQRERERAVLAFVQIPKTEVAAVLRHTVRYATKSSKSKGDKKARRKKLREREKRRKERYARRAAEAEAVTRAAAELEASRVAAGGAGSGSSSSTTTAACATLDVSNQELSGRRRRAVFSDEVISPRVDGTSTTSGSSKSASPINHVPSSANVFSSGSERGLPGLRQLPSLDSRSDLNHIASSNGRELAFAGATDRRSSAASANHASKPGSKRTSGRATPRAGGLRRSHSRGVLKPASRTDYVAPVRPHKAWESQPSGGGASRPDEDVDAYTRSLLRDLAPSQISAAIVAVLLLIFIALSLLHYTDYSTREALLFDYAMAVEREVEGQFLVWMVREEWYHRAVADSIDVFADAGQIPGEAVAKHMDYFQTAHAILLNEPAGREEALLRTECILEQDLSGYGFDEVLAAIDDAAFGPGSGSDSGIHCVRFNAAVQEFLHIAAVITDALEDPSTPASSVTKEMTWLWETGTERILPALVRSADNYFNEVSDFSHGFQTIIFAIQTLGFLVLSVGVFRSIVTHYQEDSEQVMGLLLIIPHRVAETSLDMEEYLRTLE